jgi:hypothetical protein
MAKRGIKVVLPEENGMIEV